jgi:hypothetical protein
MSCSRGDNWSSTDAGGAGSLGGSARRPLAVGRHQLARHLGRHHAFATHGAAQRIAQRVAFNGLEQVTAGTRAQGGGEVVLSSLTVSIIIRGLGRGLAQRADGVHPS